MVKVHHTTAPVSSKEANLPDDIITGGKVVVCLQKIHPLLSDIPEYVKRFLIKRTRGIALLIALIPVV